MSSTDPQLDVFARVENGKIVEFPVFRIHIENRGHSIDRYTPVETTPRPTVDAYSTVKQVVTYSNGKVVQSWEVRKLTLAELLPTLAVNDGTGKMVPPTIDKVAPEMVQVVRELVAEHLTTTLTDWASTRGYGSSKVDPFTSMMTYQASDDAEMKAEAICGLRTRDAAWAVLKMYFNDVASGKQPVPIDIATIDALIPPLKWPDEA